MECTVYCKLLVDLLDIFIFLSIGNFLLLSKQVLARLLVFFSIIGSWILDERVKKTKVCV